MGSPIASLASVPEAKINRLSLDGKIRVDRGTSLCLALPCG